MTNDELKSAFMTRCPVIAHRPVEGDIEYAYVSAVIYRRDDDSEKVRVSAELMDRSGNSVSVVDSRSISRKAMINDA